MPTSLAAKDAKANGQQQFIETVDPNIVDIRDDLIVADGEAEVSVWSGARARWRVRARLQGGVEAAS